jgi:hypothetical protein
MDKLSSLIVSFHELFSSTIKNIIFFILDDWESNWIESTHKGAEAGKFAWTAGKFYGDADKDKGIQTSQDAKFYALSTEFKPFSNKDKPLVVQFTVKHEQNIDCGGGYAKLFDCSLDQADMHGDSAYEIMFGKYTCHQTLEDLQSMIEDHDLLSNIA